MQQDEFSYAIAYFLQVLSHWITWDGWVLAIWKLSTPHDHLFECCEAQWKEHIIVCVGQEQQEEEATTVTTKVENKLLTAVSRWQLLELDLGLQCRNLPSICPINTCLHRTSYAGMTNSSRQQQFLWQPAQSPDSSRILWRNNNNKASRYSIQRCEHTRIPSSSLPHWLRLHDTVCVVQCTVYIWNLSASAPRNSHYRNRSNSIG